MLPPKPHTSQSTENLLLKCQKETHKKCLPPEWSIYPPNKEILPPPDTLALAIQMEASSSSSPNRINFFEAGTNRSVGSIVGAEYRGSIVVVPWRPGLKFVCVAARSRRSGFRVGVVREAKGTMIRGGRATSAAAAAAAVATARMKKKKDAIVAEAAAASADAAAAKMNAGAVRNISTGRNIGEYRNISAGITRTPIDDNHCAAAVSSTGYGSPSRSRIPILKRAGVSSASRSNPTRSRIPTLKGQRMSIKKYQSNRPVCFNAAMTIAIGNKSRIPTRRVVAQTS